MSENPSRQPRIKQAGPTCSAYPPASMAVGLAPGTFAVMDLLEVAAGPNRMVTFDGRVLEVFGGSVRRFHVRLLSVTVPGPDKHGNRNIVLRQAGMENSLPVDEAAYEQLQSLLAALKSVGVPVVG